MGANSQPRTWLGNANILVFGIRSFPVAPNLDPRRDPAKQTGATGRGRSRIVLCHTGSYSGTKGPPSKAAANSKHAHIAGWLGHRGFPRALCLRSSKADRS